MPEIPHTGQDGCHRYQGAPPELAPGAPLAWCLTPFCPAPQAKKQKAGEGINSRIQLVMKSGKFTLGYKTVLKQLRGGKCARRLVCPVREAKEFAIGSGVC